MVLGIRNGRTKCLNLIMIKFFRRVRFDLMANPASAKATAGKKTALSAEDAEMVALADRPARASAKAGMYFKYAIGEIILVVIGPAVQWD
jgi:hypothetical protein